MLGMLALFVPPEGDADFGPHVALDRREQEAVMLSLPHPWHIIADGVPEPRARHVQLATDLSWELGRRRLIAHGGLLARYPATAPPGRSGALAVVSALPTRLTCLVPLGPGR
jgi:hypothetical protein